jgi:hypothetical protein
MIAISVYRKTKGNKHNMLPFNILTVDIVDLWKQGQRFVLQPMALLRKMALHCEPTYEEC